MIKQTLALLALLMALSANTFAAPPKWCTGTIVNLWIDRHGSIFIYGTWRNAHTQICNLNKSWKGVSSGTCKSWQALTQQAHATQKRVLLKYYNISSCKAIGTYGRPPSPHYVMLRK
jgi:hypothetical protein